MKIKKPILLTVTAILTIAVFAYMISAANLGNTLEINLPADNIFTSNTSTVNINYTFVNGTPTQVNNLSGDAVTCAVKNATSTNESNWEHWNSTAPAVNNTKYNVLLNNDSFNTSGDLGTSGDVYTWAINCTNGTSSISSAARSFTYDAVAPVYANASANATWHSGTIQINITATDATSGVSFVEYRLSNVSGNQTPWTSMSNVTSSGGVNFWNDTFDTSTLGPGRYNITYNANDSITATYGPENTANTTKGAYEYRLDNIDPSVIHTCDTTATFKGGSITCGCSATDAHSDVDTTDFTANPSTATVGTFDITCTVTDYAGNSVVDTISYTVRGTGGAGGTSTGTGVPAATTTAMVTETLASIAANTMGTITIDNPDISVKTVGLMPIIDVTNVKIIIESLSERPATTAIPTGNVYQYLKFDVTNIADNLKSGEITFRLPNSWFTSMNINKDSVALYRFADSKWNKLPTTLESEDSGGITFKATTTGFSYFVIAGQQKGVEVVEPVEQPVTEKEPISMPSVPTWLWIVIAVIVIGIVVFYFYGKKKKG